MGLELADDFNGNERKFQEFHKTQIDRSLLLGRGCDEALFSEKKGFSVKKGEEIQ